MNWRGRLRAFFRLGRRTVEILLLIGLLGFLYLSSHGVPSRIRDHWLDTLRAQDYYVTVERIRLDLLAGVVAENLCAFEDQNHLRPLLEADQVTLFFNPLDWFQHKIGLRRLWVYNACLRLELTEKATADDSDTIVLRNVYGVVNVENNVWYLSDISADLLGLKISCRGRIRIGQPPASPVSQDTRSQQAQPEISPSNASFARVSSKVGRTAHGETSAFSSSDAPLTRNSSGSSITHALKALPLSQRERIRELIQQVKAITFSVSPHADISFQLDLEHPKANEAAIRMEGAATRAFGIHLDKWRLQAELKNGLLLLNEANIEQQGQYLACAGSYTLSNRVAGARLHGRLILQDWIGLAPQTWREALDQSGCSFTGPIQCDIRCAPCPVTEIMEHLQGWLALALVDAKGVWIEQAMAGFMFDKNTVALDPIYILLGNGAEQGPIQGHLNYAWDTGDYEGQIETRFDPHVLAPLLSSNLMEIADALVLQANTMTCNADFSGQTNRADSVWIDGDVQASNLTYNTIPLNSAHCRLDYADGLLTIDNLSVLRPEGAVTGHLVWDVDGTVLELDMLNTANPQAIARLIGPEVAEYLDGFYFAGPIRIAARGSIDYGTGALTDLRAEIEGRDWGYQRFQATHASMQAAVKQLRFDLTDIHAEVFEGYFSGRASFYPAVESGSNFCYDLYAKVNDVNLSTLLQTLGYNGQEDYEGLIDTECVLSGVIGAEHAADAMGGGWVRIQDGQLFQLRLLGGFSRLLSVVNPGLGNINPTDFAAEFTVKNNQIATTNAVLSDHNLAIKGVGYYAFDQHLDFVVWIQPPGRNRLLPNLARATAPILSSVLAVRLTGTATDPKWWPLNLTRNQLLSLPKDMLITMPKDVLIGLPRDLLVSLPYEALVTLPREILTKLPKAVLLDIPEELFIKLPQDTWNILKPSRPAKITP